MSTKQADKTSNIHKTAVCRDLLENLPFYTYVIDHSNYTIIYGNHLFRNNFKDWQSSKCHMLLCGLETPCPHCKWDTLLNGNEVALGGTIIYEYFNELDEHWYRMFERAIVW